MRALFLVPHPQEGASTRCRILQYLPWLDRAGVDYEVRPFMSPAFYRLVYQPGRYIEKVARGTAAVLRRIEDLRRARKADVVVVHREALPLGTAWVERAIARTGVPLVFDFDDAVYLGHIGEANAWTRALRRPGKTSEILRFSHRVIAGNDVLAEHARGIARDVRVIPTPVDTVRFAPRAAAKPAGSPVVIGWMGSPTTAVYLKPLEPILRELIRRHPGTEVRLVGMGRSPIDVPGVRAVPWSLAREADDLRGFDIGIMPMPDDPWTRGKCGYKALLYMAVGIPVVASPVGVNRQIVRKGVNGYLSVEPAAWLEALGHLIEDASLRARMGQQGRAMAVAAYSVAANAPRFLEALGAPQRPPRIASADPSTVALSGAPV